MATQYRYLFADLLTNQVIAELPLTGVSFGQQLNAVGTMTAHLLVSGVNTTGLNVLNATIPGRTAVYIDRNGGLVWGGILWQREYTSSDQLIKLTAREFLSYFERRRITTGSGTAYGALAYTGIDQLQIAQSLVSNASSAASGNIGLLYNQDSLSTNVSGITLSRVYYNYEVKTVFNAVSDLSKQTNGFDFEISVYYDGGGNPAKSFNTYYPRSGIMYSSTNPSAPVFELGGNIAEYDYLEDGSKAINQIYALGAGSNEGKLISIYADATKLFTGWGLLEDQANYSDITDPTVLSGLAVGQVKAVSYPPITLKIVAPPYVDPTYPSYELGDEVRVRITDAFFPSGYDAIFRIIGLTVAPGEDGPERITLTVTNGTY
jgi:hypothetical protein